MSVNSQWKEAQHVLSCCLNLDSIDFREPHPILTNLANIKDKRAWAAFFSFSKYIQVWRSGLDLSVRKKVGRSPPVQGSVTHKISHTCGDTSKMAPLKDVTIFHHVC